MPPRQARSRKTSKSQMEIIINFLENNNVLIYGKTHPLNPVEVEHKWDELTTLLNTAENGARKDKKQWKTFLYEWKSKTKKKARQNSQTIRQTGGGGYICEELNEYENRLINLYGWVHIIGCPGAPEEIDPDLEMNLQVRDELQHQDNIEIEDDEMDLVDEDNQSENNEHIIIDLQDVIEEPGPSRTIETGAVVKGPMHKKKQINSSSTKLQQSAELYSHSTEEMAGAVKEMAGAVKEMAGATSQLAEALSKIAIAILKKCDV